MDSNQRGETFIIALLFTFLACPTRAKNPGGRVEPREPRLLSLDKDDVAIHFCSRSSVVRPGVCFNGIREKPGCGGECGYCVIEGNGAIRLNCDYEIDGVVVDEADSPIAGSSIQLVMLGREKLRTRTDAAGRFHMIVRGGRGATESVRSRCLARRSFGRLQAIRDTEGIALLGEISERMMAAHPELSCARKPLSRFDGAVFDQPVVGSLKKKSPKPESTQIKLLDTAP